MKTKYYYQSEKGLTEKSINKLLALKGENAWMEEFRKTSFQSFIKYPIPKIKGIDLSEINFDDIYSFVKPVEKSVSKWSDLPSEIKETYDRLNIPEWERKYLSGISAQHESMVVYKKIKDELEKQGVIFVDMDRAVKEKSDLLKEYFGKIIRPDENKFTALNSAFWSGGVFIYVPKKTKIKLPLQSYFYIGQQKLGQFERTLIVADEESEVIYLEGCSAPNYSSYSLHVGMVEIVVKKGARVRYITVQNWSKNIYNFSFKRANVEENGVIDWTMATFGSKVTISYPTSILKGNGAKSKHLSLSVASSKQLLNSGAKVIHLASETSSDILSKSLCLKGGKNIFDGLIKIPTNIIGVKAYMRCHSLLLDNESKSISHPFLEVESKKNHVLHEATFGSLSEEQLFYIRSRGLKEDEAISLLVNGFISPILNDIPLEYAVELRRLLEMEVEKL